MFTHKFPRLFTINALAKTSINMILSQWDTAMNTIHSNTALVWKIVSSPSDAAFPQPATTCPQFQSTDQTLMHAWSFAPTRTVKEHASDRRALCHKKKPPEVYIG